MLTHVVRASRRAATPRRAVLRLRAGRSQHHQHQHQHPLRVAHRALATSAEATAASASSPPSSPLPSSSTTESESAPSPPQPPPEELIQVYEALHSAPTAPPSKTQNLPKPVQSKAVRTAFVRTWKPLTNLADAYAMMRALERKFGRILEVHFLRDFEVPTIYQNMSWIVFADAQSLQRVPATGFDFSLPSLGITKEAHELGIEDLEGVANEGDYEPGYELVPLDPEGSKDVLGGRIIRAEVDYYPEQSDTTRLFQGTHRDVLRAFLQWGGFTPLQPLPASTPPLRADDLFDGGKKKREEQGIDHVRMRAAMQLAAGALKMNNPLVLEASPREAREGVRRKGFYGVEESEAEREGVEERRRQRGAGESSYGESVFGGLMAKEQEKEGGGGIAARAAANAARSVPPSIPDSETPPSSPSSTQTTPTPTPSGTPSTTATSTSTTSTSTSTTSPSSPKPKPPKPTPSPEEQAALERQLSIARQLRSRALPNTHTHRKQPKPALTSLTANKARAAAQRIGAGTTRVGPAEWERDGVQGAEGQRGEKGKAERGDKGQGKPKQPELEFFQGEKVEEEVKNEKRGPGVLGRLFGFLKR